jgi:hypothetical protein
VADFQERRNKVTDEDVKHFTSVRKMEAMPTAWQKPKEAVIPEGSLKYYVKGAGQAPLSVKIAADLARQPLHVVKVTPEIEKKFKGQNFPALEIEGNTLITSEEAQAAYILREKKDLLGASAFEEAQVNQYLSLIAFSIGPNVQ